MVSSKPASREQNMRGFRAGLESGWGVRELPALLEAAPPAAIRVLAARHGMARSNDLRGALSCFNRDAVLNEVGHAQVQAVGAALEQLNVADSFDLVIVSPFTRALQTASEILGASGRHVPTLVQPLCAEHTLPRSVLQRGDRGSTATGLARAFPAKDYPQFDFSPLREYCKKRGLEGGKWWAHSAGEWCESRASFAKRCCEFKRWLSEECTRRGAKRVLLVSHGGTLRETFGSRFQNAECRVVDIFQDGSFAFAVPPEASSCTSRARSSRRANSLGGSFSSEYSDYSNPDILDSCSFGSETSSCSSPTSSWTSGSISSRSSHVGNCSSFSRRPKPFTPLETIEASWRNDDLADLQL